MPVSGLGPYDDQNIFAKILRGEIPCRKVHEDEWALAFEDIACEDRRTEALADAVVERDRFVPFAIGHHVKNRGECFFADDVEIADDSHQSGPGIIAAFGNPFDDLFATANERTTERLSAPFAAEYLSWELPPLAVDVRTPRERETKHIAGSLSIPLNHLAERCSELPIDRPLLVYCAGGYRSSIAASLLQRHGFNQVSEIAGGITAWDAGKLPVEM